MKLYVIQDCCVPPSASNSTREQLYLDSSTTLNQQSGLLKLNRLQETLGNCNCFVEECLWRTPGVGELYVPSRTSN